MSGVRSKAGRKCKYPWYTMPVDSWFAYDGKPRSASAQAAVMQNKTGRQFSVQTLGSGTVRVWRTA